MRDKKSSKCNCVDDDDYDDYNDGDDILLGGVTSYYFRTDITTSNVT